MPQLNIVPALGQRGLSVGKTGSGKTAFNCWLISNYLGDGIIFDTKIEPKFSRIPDSRIAHNWESVRKIWHDDNKTRVIIFRPPIEDVSDPEALDEYLRASYNMVRGGFVYVDEITQFYTGARTGPGLLSLLSRGRSKGKKTLMSTQRPAWLSRSCLTESDKFYLYPLLDMRDYKVLDNVVPRVSERGAPPKYHFWYHDSDLLDPVLMKPVPLDLKLSGGYTDSDNAEEYARRWT